MKRIFDKLTKLSNDSSIPLIGEEMLTALYGSFEAGLAHLVLMKGNSQTDEEFINKLNYEFFVEEMHQLMDLYKRFDSITTFIEYASQILNGEKQEILKTDRPTEFIKFIKKITPAFEKYDKKIIISDLNITYSIKETREELDFQNQRTFKKWLNHFYGDKFDGKKHFTIDEYADVFKKFFLKSDEADFEAEKFNEEYLTRIQQGLRYTKAELKQYSENNYKILKNEILEIDSLLKLELPTDVDIYPFSIADLIKKNLV